MSKKEEECISPNTYLTALIKTKYFNYIITKRCKITFFNFKKIKKPIYKQVILCYNVGEVKSFYSKLFFIKKKSLSFCLMIVSETFTFYFLLFFLIELKKLIKLHISRINSANNLIKLSITPPVTQEGFCFPKM